MLNSRGCILTPLAVTLDGEKSEIKTSAIYLNELCMFLLLKLIYNYIKY